MGNLLVGLASVTEIDAELYCWLTPVTGGPPKALHTVTSDGVGLGRPPRDSHRKSHTETLAYMVNITYRLRS